MSVTITLHENLNDLRCADPFTRNYLAVLMCQPVEESICNVHTRIQALQIDDVVLPITITDYQAENSYVCSPFNHYFEYGLEEIELLDNPALVNLIRAVIAPIKSLYQQGGFDQAVMVNNYLLSTNLWQKLSREQVEAVVRFLQERFPERAIVFRSVDEQSNPELYQSFVDAGCQMMFSRKVYFQDVQSAYQKRDFKRDLRLCHETDYELVSDSYFDSHDFARIEELYRMLYLEKYSRQNPQFTASFLCQMWGRGLMRFRAFRKNGRIDAVLAYYVRDGIMTQPVFGYDTSLPQETGLYRLLSTQVVLEAESQGYCIHASAGVGQFKRLRGATPVTEYNAIYTSHLPAGRQLLWKSLAGIMNRIALPVIDRYGF